MKTLAKWALIVLMWSSLSASAWATDATSLICGSDPAILTPIYPIQIESKSLKLGATPDVVFTFEGEKPCSIHQCSITIRTGNSNELISKFKINHDNITYCRRKESYFEILSKADLPFGCQEKEYMSFRLIIFEGKVQDIDTMNYEIPSLSIEWRKRDENNRFMRSIDDCFNDRSSYARDIMRYITSSGALLETYKTGREN